MGDGAKLGLSAVAALLLVSAGPAFAVHFEKESEDTQRIAPQLQQGEPGGPQTSVAGDLKAEFAKFQVSFTQSNDCGVSCDNAECAMTPMDVQCTNLAAATIMIQPDPGELPGAPVSVCVFHSYEMSVTSSGAYSGYSAVGGVPTVTVDPTLVAVTSWGVEFSNGPVQITSGTTADVLTARFTAHVGDTIEARLGTEVKGGGTGIGSFRGVETAELRVFICPPAEPAPALSQSALGALIVALFGFGVYGVRRRRVS